MPVLLPPQYSKQDSPIWFSPFPAAPRVPEVTLDFASKLCKLHSNAAIQGEVAGSGETPLPCHAPRAGPGRAPQPWQSTHDPYSPKGLEIRFEKLLYKCRSQLTCLPRVTRLTQLTKKDPHSCSPIPTLSDTSRRPFPLLQLLTCLLFHHLPQPPCLNTGEITISYLPSPLQPRGYWADSQSLLFTPAAAFRPTEDTRTSPAAARLCRAPFVCVCIHTWAHTYTTQTPTEQGNFCMFLPLILQLECEVVMKVEWGWGHSNFLISPITTNHKPFYTFFFYISNIIITIKAAADASMFKAQFWEH